MSPGTLGSLIDSHELLEAAASLPPLPTSVVQLATLVADPEVDLRRIAEVISFDQTLTASILRHANSAALGGRQQITSPLDAVVRLGTTTVLALATSFGVSRRLEAAVPEYGIEAGDLWRHAVAATIAAEVVKGRCRLTIPAEVATAALLHDIGKLVLCRYLSPNIMRLIAMAAEADGFEPWQAELAVLEVHHGEVGGLILQAWRLPDPIVSGVTHHHHPETIDEPITHAVALADVLAHDLLEGPGLVVLGVERGGERPPAPPFDPERRDRSLAALRFTEGSYEELLGATALRYHDVANRFDGS